ncbi:unnamed protein product [Acanthoscelides obtectus]|uniref:Tetraspanin n=1 Tax=Acanthoscelides obtectus TaxID=200917 RepID=A0A9P0PTK2_ACAOB|nr:unnamed protein product [Acanthoscelides obtectus]CAK1661241.1 Leukocyte surface antigen CD53 [Acanthoscelides obtectus]
MERVLNRKNHRYGAFIKYSLFGINALSLISGFIVLVLGVWTIASRLYFNVLLGTNLYAGAALILTITAVFVIVITFLGCLGVIKEVRCMLVIYFTVVFILFVTMIVGSILAFVFRSKVITTIRLGMESSLRDYGNIKYITEAWDETQTRLKCCGVYGYRDWQSKIPESCCKLTSLGQRLQCQALGENNNHFTIFTEGCLEVTKEFVRDQAIVIGSSGIVVSIIMVSICQRQVVALQNKLVLNARLRKIAFLKGGFSIFNINRFVQNRF